MSSLSLPVTPEQPLGGIPLTAPPQSEIPDGGLNAYLQVLGAHLLIFNSWGVINTFGVYQAYYSTNFLSHETASAISWIGTIQGFLIFLIGILTGPIFDRGYFRSQILIGSSMVVFGLMMTSLGTTYYQIILSQGVCVGLGTGFLFVPSVAIVASYFTSKRALMISIGAAGSSTGGVVYSIVFRKLQPTIGFAWATRIIAFMALAMLCLSIAIMRMRTAPSTKPRALLDLPAFREAPFNIFSVAIFLSFVGLYFPFFYATIYGSRIADLPDDISFYLLPVLNAGSVFGRLISGLVADKAGSLNTIIPCSIAATVLAFAWLVGITDAAGLWVFCALYGFFSGAIVSLQPTIVPLICPDMRLFATRTGMSFTFAGVGLLIGNPIAGTFVNVLEGKFEGAIVFSATTLLAAAILLVGMRVLLLIRRKELKA